MNGNKRKFTPSLNGCPEQTKRFPAHNKSEERRRARLAADIGHLCDQSKTISHFLTGEQPRGSLLLTRSHQVYFAIETSGELFKKYQALQVRNAELEQVVIRNVELQKENYRLSIMEALWWFPEVLLQMFWQYAEE